MKVALLRKFWIDNSLAVGVYSQSGFKHWLSSDNYFINSVTTEKCFSLYVRDPASFKNALSVDSFRMGMNSLQSIHGIRINPVFSKLSAWHLIQAYYAAFFAAHSALRLFGRPMLYFEDGHSKHISSRAKIELGLVNSITNGSFCAMFDSSTNNLEFSYQRDAHRDMWRQYNILLNKLSIDVLTARGATEDLSDCSSFLCDLSALLHHGSGKDAGNWLSVLRNEYNYRSPDAVWFPFAGNFIEASKVFASARVWHNGGLSVLDCESKKTEIEKYFFTCLLVVQLSTQLLLDYGSVAETRNSKSLLFSKFRDFARASYDV